MKGRLIMTNTNIILSELQELKSEARTNPDKSVSNLLNLGQNNDNLNIDESLMDAGIYGKIEYMLNLKHQCIDNLNSHYYRYAVNETATLDKLDNIDDSYIIVNEDGLTIAPVTSDAVIEAIKNVVYNLKKIA